MPKETGCPFKLCQKKTLLSAGFFWFGLRWMSKTLWSQSANIQRSVMTAVFTPPPYKIHLSVTSVQMTDQDFSSTVFAYVTTVIFLSGVWNKKSNTLYYNSVSMFKKLDRREGKGRRCCLGDKLQCRTSHLAARMIWIKVFWKDIRMIWIKVFWKDIHFGRVVVLVWCELEDHPFCRFCLFIHFVKSSWR